jgi:transcriptional regulator with XRE-family HTH domain
MPHKVHPICKQIRDLRMASRLSLTQAEKVLGVSGIVLGSYERGDRIPPLTKVDDILKGYGYRLAAVPVDFDAIRLPSDMATELRAIADQLEREKHDNDVSELPSTSAL